LYNKLNALKTLSLDIAHMKQNREHIINPILKKENRFMKYTRMTWSLVALSSSLHLGAAASAEKTKLTPWEAARNGEIEGACARRLHDYNVQEARRKNVRFFKEKVAQGSIVRPDAIQCTDAYLAIKTPTSQAREAVHAELLSATPALTPTVYTFDSQTKEFIPCKHKSKDMGTVEAGKHYGWKKECSVEDNGITGLWRPQELDYVSTEPAPVRTLTALKNTACSSVCLDSLDDLQNEHAGRIMFLEDHLPLQAQRFNTEQTKTLTATLTALEARRDVAIAALNLDRNEDRAAAHRIRAVLTYFNQGSSIAEIYKQAFGTKSKTDNSRFSIVRMLAEIVSHVQDPTYRPWMMGAPVENPNEPQDVKDLQAAMLVKNAATSEEAQISCDAHALAVHAEAVKYLNSLVKPKPVMTQQTREEVKPFDTAVVTAYELIRQCNEAELLLAALTSEASSSASSSSAV
jgi:hypothetical protein